ncbi:MAG: multifunctional oxoglutarate decarboxylase/oxoglutarate dehydrogenase thiamine pyrophosphate-binding subunit/dihydrolipoyllysine-residue succinyltransferase subunit, partial [Saccharothrix sp.]|nr:multifunctional oxoglutarate decarboxylase/oxoglutarate dehydrogenase thiamine pyrophosphate-binding subunit/dihydrolipoyllysine-residue succinyltransferase subunit [Saccharothrix sp.]
MSSSSPASQFGPNEWLVEEMYEQFLADPSSVDPAWHDFFADYKSTQRSGNGATTAAENGTTTATKTAPAPSAPTAAPASKQSAQAQQAPQAQPTQQPTTGPKSQAAPTGQTAQSAPKPAAKPAPAQAAKAAPVQPAQGEEQKQLRGAAAAIAKNMELSLTVPTATSVRAVPAKLLADNRIVINNHLKRTRGGKVSFTHLIGYAVVRALKAYPNMNRHFAEVDGKPFVVTPEHVNFGLAIDLPGKDGARTLVVASIKGCENMTFTQFWQAYEDLIRKARTGSLTTEDFSGTTISLTNPGTIGTNHSVPRLQAGQGTIIGVGAMEYPAHFQGTSEQALTDMGVSKVITLTSTYDHRVIQGAESGEFLRRIHQLLLGEDGFYDDVFTSLRLPYEPIRW